MFTVPCPNCSGKSCEECGGSGELQIRETEFSRDKKRWDKLEDHIMESLYKDLPYKHIGVLLGRSEQSVRNRCWEKGWKKQVEDWTPLEIQELATWYAEHDGGRGELLLDELAVRLGRHKTNVCRKAKELGLTDSGRPFSETLLAIYKESCKGMWDRRAHPKGMLGKSHTPEAKKKMSETQTVVQNAIPEEDRKKRAIKGVATKVEKYGAGSVPTSNTFSRCKRGKRADLGDFFFRSSWEANYARYLNLLVQLGKIVKWEYEVDTFVFHGEIRGAISYLPDFKIWKIDGGYEYHEVKGWMNGPSVTKLKRMKKHYPEQTVVVVGAPEYKLIQKNFEKDLPNWE